MIHKKARIYIAGHKGLVGSALLAKFKNAGYTNLITISHLELDLTRQDLVDKFFKKERPEYVVVAAAKVGGIKTNMTQQAQFLYENLMIQNNLIWMSHHTEVKKLLFLLSSCIYPRDCRQPMKEDSILTGKLESTNEGYAVAKIAGLMLCKYISKQYNKKFICAMPASIYGPNDNFDPQTSHVLPALIRKFLEAKKKKLNFVEIWGSGNAKREFLYVEDLANALFFLMQNYNDPQFINIGTGSDISIKKLALLIKKNTGFHGDIKFNTSIPDGMPRKLLNIDRISSLGWKPTVSLEQGLKHAISWYRKNYEV
jgi:GDP-L-fucose synthase